MVEDVKINTENSDKIQHCCEKTEVANEHEKRMCDMEKQLRENSENIERDNITFMSTIKSLTDRYDKEFQDLKKQFNDMHLTVKRDAEKNIETDFVSKYRDEIHNLKDQLVRKNAQYITQLTAAEKKSEETSSQCEVLLISKSDQHAKVV